mgnify:FL=1
MSYSRYFRRSTFINNNPEYRKKFFQNERGVSQIEQYNTPVFTYPSVDVMQGTLNIEPVRWGATTKLYNLADEYYGDVNLWWVIAWFNRKPTDGHYSIGDIVYIPMPADAAIDIFEAQQ